MNKTEDAYALKWAKKIRSIQELGNKCQQCGDDNIVHLDFHHLSGKDRNIGKLLLYRWSRLQREIKKCILLCRNCHLMHHFPEANPTKVKLMEMTRMKKCHKCGYNKNPTCLDFHHERDTKEFGISRAYIKDRLKIPIERIISEIEKCSLLCRNCHADEHFDKKRFDLLWPVIQKKMQTYIEQDKISIHTKSRIFNLKNSGHSIRKIAASVGCSKSSVHNILRSGVQQGPGQACRSIVN